MYGQNLKPLIVLKEISGLRLHHIDKIMEMLNDIVYYSTSLSVQSLWRQTLSSEKTMAQIQTKILHEVIRTVQITGKFL
jgi:DNA polymerase III delta prime subunit